MALSQADLGELKKIWKQRLQDLGKPLSLLPSDAAIRKAVARTVELLDIPAGQSTTFTATLDANFAGDVTAEVRIFTGNDTDETSGELETFLE